MREDFELSSLQVRRTGRANPARPGFTVVELLLVLAVIALLGAVLLPGVNSMLQSITREEPEQILLGAVNRTREEALSSRRIVRLRADAEKNRLVWGEDAPGQHRALPAGTGVQFLPAQTGATVLLGGQLTETSVLPAVRFFPDGTCDAFRARLRRGPAAAPLLIRFDPWTCAPLEEQKP